MQAKQYQYIGNPKISAKDQITELNLKHSSKICYGKMAACSFVPLYSCSSIVNGLIVVTIKTTWLPLRNRGT